MSIDATAECSVIELRLPPSLRFASVVRVVAASLAADESFTITALAEVRSAVQHAFEMVLEETVPRDRRDAETALDVRFLISPGRVQIDFSMASDAQPFAVASPSSNHVEESGAVLVVEDGRVSLTKRVPRNASSSQR